MKSTLRNGIIFVLSATGVVFLYRFFKRRDGPLVRVIVFHDVTDRLWFEGIMQTLTKKYKIISYEEFKNKSFAQDKINVLVTFDDGYASWILTSLPVLRAHSVEALFFTNSGFVDSSGDSSKSEVYVRNKLLLNSTHEGITWEGIVELSRNGHAIGGHTMNHVRLASVNEPLQKEEIEQDKIRIEEMIQKKCSAFAYPFGNSSDYTDHTKLIVQNAGYTHAFTTEGSFVSSSDEYAISRMCIPDALSKVQFDLWIQGGYDVYARLKKICAL